MLRPIPFIVFPHLNVEGDMTHPAWLVSGLVYADPGYPRATGLHWGPNIIGRWIDQFSEIAERTLETEHFRIDLGVDELDEMQAIFTQLGPDDTTTIHLGSTGPFLDMRRGEQYSLYDEILIEAGERHFAFKMNPFWKKWARK